MKKIFTFLLISVFTVGVASAQSGRFDYGKNDIGYNMRGKQDAIRKINQEYDFKIAAVSRNRWMNRWEKTKQIRQLEAQRDAAIARVKFGSGRDGHYYGNDKYSKDNSHRW